MPRTVTVETYDQQGALVSRTERQEPLIVAGQYRETHQVAVGGATLRVGPAPDAPTIAQLPMSTPVADSGQRQGLAAYVMTDLGTGWVALSKLIAL